MSYKYFPHTQQDISEMLKVIGVGSLEELYAEIPEELKFVGELDMPSAKSEIEVREIIEGMAARNKQLVCFAGCGTYNHYTPSVIPYIASRSEFSTSYTPYQLSMKILSQIRISKILLSTKDRSSKQMRHT